MVGLSSKKVTNRIMRQISTVEDLKNLIKLTNMIESQNQDRKSLSQRANPGIQMRKNRQTHDLKTAFHLIRKMSIVEIRSHITEDMTRTVTLKIGIRGYVRMNAEMIILTIEIILNLSIIF